MCLEVCTGCSGNGTGDPGSSPVDRVQGLRKASRGGGGNNTQAGS